MIDQLIELTKTNQFFQGTFFVGLLAGIAYTAKNWLYWAYSRIKRYFTFSVLVEEKSELYNAINNYLYGAYNTCFKNVEADMKSAESKPDKLNNKFNDTSQRELVIKQNIDTFIIWINKRPIYIIKSKQELKGANDIYSVTYGAFEIKTLFGKDLVFNFLNKIIDDYNAKMIKCKEVEVYTPTLWSHNKWELHKSFTPISIERVVMDANIKESLLNDIEKWLLSKDHYVNLGLTHKRGYLLYGEPGNGKSSIVMAIAKKYNRNIFYLDINAFTSESQLREAFSNIPKNSILLIEDIDQVWKGREPVNKDCKITFSLFLNLLNGVLDKEDVLLFMTTNKLDELDEALIRPGRIDYRLEVTKPNITLVEKYLSNYYGIDIKLDSYDKNYSYAQLLDLCKRNEDYKDVVKEL